MKAQILFPKDEPYMLGFIVGNLPRFEKTLRQKAPSYIKGRLVCVELDLREQWEILVGLELLTQLDEVYLASHPKTKPLYKSGVKYLIEAPGLEEWLTIPVLYERGVGDCEDLACALCAEKRFRGIACDPFVSKKGHVWHVMSRCGDLIEDPSRVLGMGR